MNRLSKEQNSRLHTKDKKWCY